ncbi:MAG: hypothetical protein R3C11_24060 [Planctomycetaceae bacterium]
MTVVKFLIALPTLIIFWGIYETIKSKISGEPVDPSIRFEWTITQISCAILIPITAGIFHDHPKELRQSNQNARVTVILISLIDAVLLMIYFITNPTVAFVDFWANRIYEIILTGPLFLICLLLISPGANQHFRKPAGPSDISIDDESETEENEFL